MLHCPICGLQYSTDTQVCPVDNSPLQADPTAIGDETPVDPLIGYTHDDKYRIEKRLGIGGMCTVYRARHLLIDRPVAIKVLNPRFVEDEAAQVRFRREARAAGRLQHTNAVGVTDFGSTSGYVYIVMELLEGRTLREVLAKEAPLDTARAVALMLQTAAAVAAAHEAGIIHRDLKPANIFIVQNSEVPAVVKVLDFGIAKLAAESFDDDDPKTLTLVGVMIGTPRYMSPEQCDGAELTPAADVYSLGVILYEMLSGVVPFSGSTPLAIAIKHSSEEPRRPSEYVASIPPALEQVVLHALQKRPEDRPANAAEFRLELLATAERLGLEHAAVTSAPDIQALRDVGTESPSGRLVIDISRLRENRAATSSGETTVISPALAAAVINSDSTGAPAYSASVSSGKQSFPRVRIELGQIQRFRKEPLLILALAGLILVAAISYFALRSQDVAPATNANATASPSPSVSPTPAPTPLPTSEQKHSAANANANANANENTNENANKKKGSKVGRALKKVGRILKKPF
ncbi:MAG: serine/threonine protein kinase [Pyrinomonadaceae bacterium]|nr:serine/threonine protein kinase [Pyrinomonadaceae bacterium]